MHAYEDGIRVPAWVSWPARLESGIIDQSMDVAGWLPTLCGLAGVEALPDNLDGIDVLGLLEGKTVTRNYYWAWGKNFSSSAPCRSYGGLETGERNGWRDK